MSPSTLCNALAGTIADRLDQGLLEDKETFKAVLDTAGLPGLEVVKASPASVEKAACEQASPALAVNVVFSLGGALEETLYSTAGKDQLCMAIASVAGVGKEHIEVSVTAGSTGVKSKLNMELAKVLVGPVLLRYLSDERLSILFDVTFTVLYDTFRRFTPATED